MNVFVRVDASKDIGTGHFFRCLTLSQKICSKGHSVTFISSQMPQELIKILHLNKIYFKRIYNNNSSKIDNLAHSHWLGVSQKEDAHNFKQCLKSKIDLLVIDHYGIDETWENELRAFSKKILVIDDLADRNHNCDFLLDQNYYPNLSTRYKGRVPNDAFMLLGPNYCLLRDDFAVLRKSIYKTKESINRIFVFFGGIDNENHTKITLDVLGRLEGKNFLVDVVVGSQNPNKNIIKSMCKKFSYNFHCQTSKIAKIMHQSDLAIGAAGSTSWERCCLGLPAIIIPIAKNQIEIATSIHNFGAAICIEGNENLHQRIYNTIKSLQLNNKILKKMNKACLELVDGLGVERVIMKLNL